MTNAPDADPQQPGIRTVGTPLVTSLRAGVPVKVVSERLGHASVAFTQQVYMHVIPGMDEEGAQLAAAAIFGAVTDDLPVSTEQASPLR